MIPGMCETGTWSAIVEVHNLQDTLAAWEFITMLRKCEYEGTPCSINYDEENHRGWLIKEFDINFANSDNLSPLRTVYPRMVKLEYDALDYDVLGYGDIEEVVLNEADSLERAVSPRSARGRCGGGSFEKGAGGACGRGGAPDVERTAV